MPDEDKPIRREKMWVYRKLTKGEEDVYEVGFFYLDSSTGLNCWHSVERYAAQHLAQKLVHYLNGGN